MCGIVAIITKNLNGFNKDQVDAFDNLLYVDALRGMDSTGVFLVDNKGNMSLAKEASAAHDFRKAKEYDTLLKEAFRHGSALIGHNRSATKGSVNDQNAHPFVVDDRITLIHNGTLWGNHRELADVDVDSHAIAHTIHNKDGDVEAALQEIKGAYALIWHDFKLRTINIVRNAQRPMHWVETDKAWIYASERNMIEWILARFNTMKIVGEIHAQPVGTLTTFTQSEKGWEVESKDIELEKKVQSTYQAVGGSAYNGTPFRGWSRYDDVEEDAGIISYFGLSKAERQDLSAMVEQPTVHLPRLTATPPARDVVQAERLRDNESMLAITNKIDLTFPHYTEEVRDIKNGSYYDGRVVEYDYIDDKEKSTGFYIYAIPDKFPNFLVRFTAPKSTSEYDILDLCLNNRRVIFSCNMQSWRAFKGRVGGYGMLYSTSMKPIEEQLSDEDFANFELGDISCL